MAPKLAHLMKMINLQSPKFNELQKQDTEKNRLRVHHKQLTQQ